MPGSRPPMPNRVREAADLRPISRPNVNFDRTAVPLPTHVGTNHLRDLLRQPTRVWDSGKEARLDAPLPVSTSSINWWPYPPWGQSTVSLTPSETPTSSSLLPSLVAAASLDTPSPTTTSLAVTPTPNPSAVLGGTVVSVAVPTPTTSLPSRSNVHAAAHSSFNPLYLIPVFIAVGLVIGALSGLLGYRWYMRRQARKGGGRSGSWKATLIPGPPYVPVNDTNHAAGGTLEVPLTPVGSPSKYTRHGTPRAAGSRRASTHSTASPSRETTTAAAASSHLRPLSASPTRARSRGSTISPSDEESSRHNSSRNTSIRRNILKRLQRGPNQNTRGVSRDLSRRTAQTYVSTASAYSGTHSGDSRAPSAVPSSTPPSCDNNTEWVPGSGFRIVEETISSPCTAGQSSQSSLPGPTSAWDNGEALRQAVGTHPGERWLAWTRSWASSPPPPSQDRFTAVPSRRVEHEKKDVEVLLRSPPQVTSSPLQSTLTFSPEPGLPARPGTGTKRHLQGTARTRAGRGISIASSVAQGDGHGTPAMRYAARHTALSRVEEILAQSYSSRDLAHDSPHGFGAAPATSLGDIGWAAGIEHRLAVAEFADRDEV